MVLGVEGDQTYIHTYFLHSLLQAQDGNNDDTAPIHPQRPPASTQRSAALAGK